MAGLVHTAVLVSGNRVERARAAVLELSRCRPGRPICQTTVPGCEVREREYELVLSSLSLSCPRLAVPTSFIEWTFLTFRSADFRSNAPEQRRFTAAIRNRRGGPLLSGNYGDYEVDFRRTRRLYKTRFVLEEGIID